MMKMEGDEKARMVVKKSVLMRCRVRCRKFGGSRIAAVSSQIKYYGNRLIL